MPNPTATQTARTDPAIANQVMEFGDVGLVFAARTVFELGGPDEASTATATTGDGDGVGDEDGLGEGLRLGFFLPFPG